jgi:hypothetical protein
MMNLTKSSNPALSERVFQKEYTTASSEVMTVNGSVYLEQIF